MKSTARRGRTRAVDSCQTHCKGICDDFGNQGPNFLPLVRCPPFTYLLSCDNALGGAMTERHTVVLFFGLRVSRSDVYVKLQLILTEGQCVCVSFHPAAQPLHYPLREGPAPSGKGDQR